MLIGDRTPGTVAHSSAIRRCHGNMCQSLGNVLIYSSVFVAAEKRFNSPLQWRLIYCSLSRCLLTNAWL
jgi:hypothetical protein